MKSRRALATILILVALAVPLFAAIPAYMPKPPLWRSSLVTVGQGGVADAQLAMWIKQAETNAGLLATPRTFELVAVFTQCYGGGFLTEIGNANVTLFGANSASRFYETVTYNTANNRSYYAYAWKTKADVAGGPTDQTITDNAYNATIPPGAGGITPNPDAAHQRAQYLTAGGPLPIASMGPRFAILFAGRPRSEDQTDLSQIYDVLRTRYNFAAADIHILYGNYMNGTAPAGVAWTSSGPATAQELQQAWANWLIMKLNGLPDEDTHAQVFFWAADHGGADFPISITVDNISQGKMGSGVRGRFNMGFAGATVYEAMLGNNSVAWRHPGNLNLGDISFGDDFVAAVYNENVPDDSSPSPSRTTGQSIIYFSVDRTSQGLLGSAVRDELTAGRAAAPDIFTATDGSNRLLFDGRRNLGLLEPPLDNVVDDVKGLAMRDIGSIANLANNTLTKPLFFILAGTTQIWVIDPNFPGAPYLYYDFATDFPNNPPPPIDALALLDDGQVNAMGKLFFNPAADRMLFSIARTMAAPPAPWNNYKPCDIIKHGVGLAANAVAMWRTCRQLGLDAMNDNVDALDLGAGAQGEPKPFNPDRRLPSPDPYPGPEPEPWQPAPTPTPTPTPTPMMPPPPGM